MPVTPSPMILKNGHLGIPVDPASLHTRPAPLVLEVGFGDGRFLSHLGTAHPEWNLLGAEVSLGSVWRAYRRMKRDDIENVRLYKGNAGFIVRDVMPEGALHRVYVNFPDPWPRKKHWPNRLLQREFFRTLSTRLEDGGDLLLTTDHPGYFEFAVEEGTASGCYHVEQGPPPPATLETKYALKWRGQNKPIFHVRFRLKERAPFTPPQTAVVPMQHALLTGTLATIGPFSKQVRRFEGGTAIVLEAFRDLSNDALLFKVVSEEPDLRQELLVQAWQKEADAVFVSLQGFGEPLSTRGVREAVMAVAVWLESQGLAIKESWI